MGIELSSGMSVQDDSPGSYPGKMPSCYACKDAPYQNYGPIFSGCDMCADVFSTMQSIDALVSDNDPLKDVPIVENDPAGGLFLKLV